MKIDFSKNIDHSNPDIWCCTNVFAFCRNIKTGADSFNKEDVKQKRYKNILKLKKYLKTIGIKTEIKCFAPNSYNVYAYVLCVDKMDDADEAEFILKMNNLNVDLS